VTKAKARMIDGGRVVLPAEIRRAMQLKKGDTLVLELKGDELRMRSSRAALRRIQESLRSLRIEGSIVDGLIAERRREARMEDEGR
jgi:AbrB family looped-hinge helix DNA binding protein